MKKQIKELIIVAFIVLFLQQIVFSSDNSDLQLWNGLKFQYEIFPNTKMFLVQWFRFNDEVSQLYWIHSDIGFTYSIAKWCSVGFNYWHVHKTKGTIWNYDNRPKLRTTFKLKMGILSLSDRNMFEYHIKKSQDNLWVYRNKATLQINSKLVKVPLKPYIANEMFISMTNSDFQYNRVYGGVQWKFTKSIGLNSGYFWQAGKRKDKVYHTHVLVLNVAITK